MVTKIVRMPLVVVTLIKGWRDGVALPPFLSFFRVYGYIGHFEGVNEWLRCAMHVTRGLVVGVDRLFPHLKKDCSIQVVWISSARFDCLYVPTIFLTLLKY